MKVYIHALTYLPKSRNGATLYAHGLAKLMLSWGWQVKVLRDQIQSIYEYDGVSVYPFEFHVELMQWADIVLCEPTRMSLFKGHPNVIVMQHTAGIMPGDYEGFRQLCCAEHVREKCGGDHVWHPFNRYAGTEATGHRIGVITLVNCNIPKGGSVLIALAKAMPNEYFCGVTGGYGKQQQVHGLDNLTYWDATDDLSPIFKRTQILIMPSVSEGFPTVAIEAMAFGIPVIGWPCEGIIEATGQTFIHADKMNVDDLKAKIEMVQEYYNSYSKLALDRANEIEGNRNYQQLKYFLCG